MLARSLFYIGHLEEHEGDFRITSGKNGRYPMADLAFISGKTFGFCYQTVNYFVVCDNYAAFMERKLIT
jgi:hypothetical protein